jgi:hypothetical protein
MTATHCYCSNLAICHPSSLIRPRVIQQRASSHRLLSHRIASLFATTARPCQLRRF